MRPRDDGYGSGMGVSRITSRASGIGATLGRLAHDLDHLFLPPRALPSVDDRARAVVDEIDWSQDTIVLWMPGTSEYGIVPDVAKAFARRKVRGPVAVPYQATWRLADSVPDGEAVLRGVLDLVRVRRHPGQRIVLLGQSQGAWVISSILREKAYASIVDRVGLVAHPALAPAHGHETSVPSTRLGRRVREFNDPGDVVTRDLGEVGPKALAVIDSFARLDVGRALVGTLGIAVRDPAALRAFIASQLFRVKGGANPHESGSLLDQALDWVLDAAKSRD